MNIGIRIKNMREDLDMTQKRLADASCINRQATIAEIESGKRDPSATELVRIAEALNTSVHYLVTGIEPQNISIAEETGLSDDSIATLRELRKKDTDKSLRITALIHALLGNEDICLRLSDYLYRQYDAFSGMIDIDKDYVLSLYGEAKFHELAYWANLEPTARLDVMDRLKELREEIQNGKS